MTDIGSLPTRDPVFIPMHLDIGPTDLKPVGQHLQQPECVLATAGGTLCVADRRGGVSIIHADGNQQLISANPAQYTIKPSGIATTRKGEFLLAHRGDGTGGLYRLGRDGSCSSVLQELDGDPIPPCNHLYKDGQGRIWLTVSGRHQSVTDAYAKADSAGYIVLIDDGNARVVADKLGHDIKCCTHPSGDWLYVTETFARRLSRYRLHRNGDLSAKQTIAEFSHGTYPDGLNFDVQGGIWITSLVSNRIIRIGPDNQQYLLFEDADASYVEWVEQAYQNDNLMPSHLDQIVSQRLKNLTSLAFGGPNLRTVYLGCRSGSQLMSFRSPVAGFQPPHWHHPI